MSQGLKQNNLTTIVADQYGETSVTFKAFMEADTALRRNIDAQGEAGALERIKPPYAGTAGLHDGRRPPGGLR
ncbi:hypothetical protein GCM10009780_69020 [Actinomadura alba]